MINKIFRWFFRKRLAKIDELLAITARAAAEFVESPNAILPHEILWAVSQLQQLLK